MSFQLVEDTSQGVVVHNVDNADAALNLWYGIDGEVTAIKDEHQETISLPELIALVASAKPSADISQSRIEIYHNEDLKVGERKENTRGYPLGRFPPRA